MAVAVNYVMQKRSRKDGFFPDNDNRHCDASTSTSARTGMHIGGLYGTVGSGGGCGGGGIRRFDRGVDCLQVSAVCNDDTSYDDDDNGEGSQSKTQVPPPPQWVRRMDCARLLRHAAFADDHRSGSTGAVAADKVATALSSKKNMGLLAMDASEA